MELASTATWIPVEPVIERAPALTAHRGVRLGTILGLAVRRDGCQGSRQRESTGKVPFGWEPVLHGRSFVMEAISRLHTTL